MTLIRSVIRGVGAYLPKRIMTNDDLARMVSVGDNQEVALLRSQVGAGLIFFRGGRLRRGQTGTGGECGQEQRTPCLIRTRHDRSMFRSGCIIAF